MFIPFDDLGVMTEEWEGKLAASIVECGACFQKKQGHMALFFLP